MPDDTAAAPGAAQPPSRLKTFAVLHVINTGLNALFALAMLLVLSRVLAPERYGEIVFLTAFGLYVQPIDQALGRANYIVLRDDFLKDGRPRQPIAGASLFAQAGFLILVSLIVPLFLSHGDPRLYGENVLYLAFAVATTYWAFSLQSTAWSIDASFNFVLIALTQKLATFSLLAALWFTKSFLLFAGLAFASSTVAILVAGRMLPARAPGMSLKLPIRGLTWDGVRAQLKLFWSSLLATLSDFTLFNAPYALFSALFGVGAAVVTYDSIMKLGRLVLMGARTLAEVALPRQSRLMAAGEHASGFRLFLVILVLCLAGAAVPALAVWFWGPLVFDILLGPNNVVPPGAGPAAAVILMAMGLYQPAVFLLGYSNAQKEIRGFTIFALAGFVAFAGAVAVLKLPMVAALWAYSAYATAGAVVALALSLRLFKPQL